MKANPSANVSVTGGGSGVGISALLAGTTDISQMSRRIKFFERLKLRESGRAVTEVEIAYDALAVIVHPGNKVSRLTREQLEGIFTGKIKNRKEVGGDDLKIVPYSRETSSGTYEFFKERVLKNKNFMPGIMSMPANGAIIQSVSQTNGAIAYVGIAYMNNKAKAVSVSFDRGKTFMAPTPENAKNKLYPVVRPLCYNGPFIQYLSQLTDEPVSDASVIFSDTIFATLHQFLKDKSKNYFETQLSRYNKIFSLQVNIFADKSFEIMLNDITRQEKTKQLKQEMTGNIAHELRTPVTGIRTYLETVLQQDIPEDKIEYFTNRRTIKR